MFNPTRDQVRQFFFETWNKHLNNAILTQLEALALDIIAEHPEYHSLLADPERNLERNYFPEQGQTNPFLHLSLHLAVAEQLSIDQPFGIRGRFAQLQQAKRSKHEALHALIECLGEMMWHAQRNRSAPDQAIYFACIDRQLGLPEAPGRG